MDPLSSSNYVPSAIGDEDVIRGPPEDDTADPTDIRYEDGTAHGIRDIGPGIGYDDDLPRGIGGLDNYEPPQRVDEPREELRKVCLTVGTMFDEYSLSTLYIADLNCSHADSDFDSFVELMSPASPFVASFQLKHTSSDAVCVLGGSTLYMIEGVGFSSQNMPKGVFTCDLPLSSCDTFGDVVDLNLTIAREYQDMNYPKFYPVAVPTPDGKKLLVFSTAIGFYDEEFYWDSDDFPKVELGQTDFELYDPATMKWHTLPGLKPLKGPLYSITIHLYSFLTDSVFLIQTDDGDMFSIDLESLDSGWKEMDHLFGQDYSGASSAIYFSGRSLLAIGREGLFLAQSALLNLKFAKSVPIPSRLAGPSYRPYFSKSSACALDVGDEEFRFCFSEMKGDYKTESGKLIIDVYTCNIEKFREGLLHPDCWPEGIPGASIIKSFKVSLNIRSPTETLFFNSIAI